MHILAANRCFSGDGFFYVPSISIDTIERVIELIGTWKHTGFGVYLRKEDKPKRCKVTRVPGKVYHKGIILLRRG